MKPLRILCDLDAIVADLTKKWLERYNRDYADNVTKEDNKHSRMERNVKIGEKIIDYLYEDGFFRDLEPLPGAIKSLRALWDDGHQIVIASAPSWPGTSAQDKISWVREHLPFIKKRSIFLGHEKYMLKGDIFIDDSPDNIKQYRDEWDQYKQWHQPKIMTIAHPYNESIRDIVDVYAQSYKNTEIAWGTILKAIHKVAAGANVRLTQ